MKFPFSTKFPRLSLVKVENRAPVEFTRLSLGKRARKYVVILLAALALVGGVAWWQAAHITEVRAAQEIAQSMRFNAADSAYLSKTLTTPTNSKKFTFSTWLKRGNTGGAGYTFFEGGSGTTYSLFFDGTSIINTNQDAIGFCSSNSCATVGVIGTPKYRDPSAWMHVVFAVDTTQAVAANRVHIYVNGVENTYTTATYPSQNADVGVNTATAHNVGAWAGSVPFDGYMSDVYFIDGQQLDSTYFGETDANGYWRPKAYSGTYGTNGFKLDFADGSDLGNDVSGNNNDWTSNNVDATDKVTDTPTNGFPTLNPIDPSSSVTFAEGNQKVTGSASYRTPRATVGVSSGKWYWEITVSTFANDTHVGVGNQLASTYLGTWAGTTANGWMYTGASGAKWNNNSGVAYGSTFTTGDVIGVALDATNNTVWFSKNGTWQNSGDPAAGTGAAYTTLSGTEYYPLVTTANGTVFMSNFGQGGQSGLTYYSAAGGSFKYAPPSGFEALSTANMPAPAVDVPKEYFDSYTYTGTGEGATIGGATAAVKRVYLRGGTTWTVPPDFNVASNTVEVIGGGGGGSAYNHGVQYSSGGGGGAYSKTTNLPLPPGSVVTYAVGAAGSAGPSVGGSGGAGGDTWFNAASLAACVTAGSTLCVGAKGGGGGVGASGGAGGASGSGVGTTKYSGGASGGAQSGGGGAAGPNGAGGAQSGGIGGTGDAGFGGTGGVGVVGGAGTEWDSTHGSGGGGNSGYGPSANGAAGGSYGAGGGGGGAQVWSPAGGAGAQGLIVITYTPTYNFLQPSLTWLKDRTTTNAHGIFDAVRSVFPYLSTNSTAAEVATASTTLTSFFANGFTLGASSLFNTSGNAYISWNWKESATSGFDIVQYTGNGANRTIPHSLGKTADFIIIKDRAGTNDWAVYHTANTAAPETDYLLLNSTAATADDATYWNDTKPTASVFSLGTNADVNTSGNAYTAYLFASTTGYSAFGTYTGNGSADGPFIYTGFKPRYVILKRTSAVESWCLMDTARDTYNPASRDVFSDLTNAEDSSSARYTDFLSNGFKVRSTGSCRNTSGATYVYAAFAEQPFQQSAQPYNLTIASSTRFISANSDYLSRTPGSAGNRQKWTWSAWVKRATLGTQQQIFLAGSSGTNASDIRFLTSNVLEVNDYQSGYQMLLNTSAVFRDPAVWYHIVVAVDTTQAAASDRARIYVNGQQITSFSAATYPSQNLNTMYNSNVSHAIGSSQPIAASNYLDAYLADVYMIDGQQLDSTYFGETDSSGYWRPKAYSGTYGTNGFHLPLMGTSTAASVGIDTSGNNNTWTVNNIATTDFVKDSPTNNFPTLNNAYYSAASYTDGTLYDAGLAANGNYGVVAGWQLLSGKWYWEYTVGGAASAYPLLGVWKSNTFPSGSQGAYPGHAGDTGFGYSSNGNVYSNGSVAATLTTYTNADVIGVAYDADTGKVYFRKNGTWQNSADPAAGTGSIGTVSNGWPGGASYFGKTSFNFGQGGQSGLTYDSASGGYFKYTPPSGYKALSTANLSTPAIEVPKQYFEAVPYAGTGAVQTVGGSVVSFTATPSGGSWTIPPGVTSVDYLVVAGGGGGGSIGGGGGAGGVRTGTLSVTPGAPLTVTVGAGGAGASSGAAGTSGGDSVFASITSTGGGGGGGDGSVGKNGGSGGGGGNATAGGTGTAGQGSNGGSSSGASSGAGGGGASAVGSNSTSGASGVPGGAGGAGVASSITGTSVTYGGGGGGGGRGDGGQAGAGGAGGTGGGGRGAYSPIGSGAAVAGTANTGGGGGGGSYDGAYRAGAAGGSGIVIIKYNQTPQTLQFQPSLTWIKDRTTTNAHGLFDALRSVFPYLSTNSTAAEVGTASTTLTSFMENGFTLGASSLFNTNGNAYISWSWKEDATAGIDIVPYIGTGAAQTIPHSLGVAPKMMIVKDRGATNDWAVYHASNTAAPETDYLLMNSTAATADDDTYWNDTAPTASVFSVKSNADTNTSGNQYVAYLFAEKDGFSKFGSYTGNGSADGPFIYTGFKPRYLLIKRTDSTGDWYIWDTARSTFNPAAAELLADTTAADASTADLDILANGFKLRATTAAYNASGGTFVYAAFADVPLKYSASPAAQLLSALQAAVVFLIGMVF